MEYTYIPTGIGEIWCGLPLEGTVGRGPVAIHSSGQTISIRINLFDSN